MLQARTYTFKCTNTRREQDESSKTFLIYSTTLKDKCKHQVCFRRHFNHWINDVNELLCLQGVAVYGMHQSQETFPCSLLSTCSVTAAASEKTVLPSLIYLHLSASHSFTYKQTNQTGTSACASDGLPLGYVWSSGKGYCLKKAHSPGNKTLVQCVCGEHKASITPCHYRRKSLN